MALTGLVGCRSIGTTFFERDPLSQQLMMQKLDGYPITLKVPTHIRVTFYENNFLEFDGAKWQTISVGNVALSSISFSTQLIETEKIFTIDHKRPMAGELKYGVNFTSDQYIDEFSEAAVDDAIRQSSIAVARTIQILSGATPAARTDAEATRKLADGQFTSIIGNTSSDKTRPVPSETLVGGLDAESVPGETPVRSVIATELFELDDPEFELKVSDFLKRCTCHQ